MKNLKLFILTLTAATLVAQAPGPNNTPAPNQYSYDDALSSSSSETLTLQLPANSNRGWYGFWLTVSLNSPSATAKVCFLQGGTTATTTAATATQMFNAVPAVTKVFTASNSTSGTTLGCVNITGAQSWNLGNMFMARAFATVQQISIVVTGSGITGDIFPIWNEF